MTATVRPSERPRRRRRRNRCSSRRCTKRRCQRETESSGRLSSEGRQDQGMSASTRAGILEEHRTGGAVKSDGTDEFLGKKPATMERAAVAEAWPSIESGSVKENDGGGWQLFFRILEKLGERSSLARRAVRAARAAFHSHPGSQHAMWSSPRSRARFNRACVRRALASLSTTAMCESCRQTTLVDGVVPHLCRQPRISAMACISPLSFDGDKRGRMRQFYEAVAFDQKFSWSDASLRLLADPRPTPYLGPNLPLGAKTSSTCPVVADRISMPRKAAVVPLDDWLPSSLVKCAWNHPECEASSVLVAPRYFDVNMAEWRALCRRMLRSGLGKKVLPTSSLLIFLVEHSPFLKTLTETGSSVTTDLGTTHWKVSFALGSTAPTSHAAK